MSDVHPDEIPPDEFDDLVRDALDQLPDEAARLVSEIAVVVREAPEPGQAAPDQLLLGTFRGIPHTAVGGRVPGSLPDVITLFRVPILAVCRSRRRWRRACSRCSGTRSATPWGSARASSARTAGTSHLGSPHDR